MCRKLSGNSLGTTHLSSIAKGENECDAAATGAVLVPQGALESGCPKWRQGDQVFTPHIKQLSGCTQGASATLGKIAASFDS